LFDQDLRLAKAVEDLAIEQFIAEAGIEAFAIAILPGGSGLDVGRLCSDGGNPVPDGLGDELRSVVGPKRPILAVSRLRR